MKGIMNKIAILAALGGAFVLAGADSAARAQESGTTASKEDEAFQQRLFGRVPDKQAIHACFSRIYDTGHLAQHPRQNVRTMLLLVRANVDADQPRYSVRLGLTFRRSNTHFESAGNCGSIHDDSETGGSSGVAHCGVECDGGSLDVAVKDDKSVLVSIPLGVRIWRADGADDSNQARRLGDDDKAFRLERTALTECLRLADDDEEKAALRQGH